MMHSPTKFYTKLVAALKKERERQGLSYQQLADKSGLLVSTLKQYEKGAYIPRPQKLAKWLQGLALQFTIGNGKEDIFTSKEGEN